MKNYKFNTAILLIISISFLSCAQDKKKEKSDEIVEIISIEALEKADNTIQLVDVRTPEEYKEGYIKNARNINIKDDDFLDQVSKLDKDKPVYVYCMVGGRSGQSAAQLKEAGFKKVYDFKGGFKQWKAEGKKVSKID